METCDLARTARRKIIGTLSKGFRQRVGIADALLGDPEIILMDEPTIGLDPHQIQGIRKLIDQLRGRLTVLLSSHILPEIERCCDQIIIINQGSIVAQGTSEELRREFLPGNRYRIGYQGSNAALNTILEQQTFSIKTLSEHKTEHQGMQRIIDIAANSEKNLHTLIKAIARFENINMTSFALERSSLEDIFLVATKRSCELQNQTELELVRL
jgi:ABC-2 type transport system ATP-binding protein